MRTGLLRTGLLRHEKISRHNALEIEGEGVDRGMLWGPGLAQAGGKRGGEGRGLHTGWGRREGEGKRAWPIDNGPEAGFTYPHQQASSGDAKFRQNGGVSLFFSFIHLRLPGD